ncbi:MAG: MarR family transcriptional regulator [Gammaproteobacteria bacterium]|nr:MarR family transcriptional regulator [Gammaproteobacteria bacterium]
MHPVTSPLVAQVRVASRDLVRQFGLMGQGVAGTDLSLSAVHAIIEIGRAHGLSSKQLCERLLLEKSTVSRLVKSLVGKGEIRELRSQDDLRMKHLHLTCKGKRSLLDIDDFAETQVSAALGGLDDRSRQGVLQGLQDYSRALKASATDNDHADSLERVKIESGYAPTIIGRVIVMLHAYMNRHYGFGAGFESRIAGDLAEFMTRIDSPQNKTWRAESGGNIVGSISIDGEDLGDGLAHLRWFVVSDEIRGGGAGNLLLTRALEFCDERGFRETHLWTVKGLDAARKLYDSHGFELAEEYYGDQWGSEVLEQKFVRLGRP